MLKGFGFLGMTKGDKDTTRSSITFVLSIMLSQCQKSNLCTERTTLLGFWFIRLFYFLAVKLCHYNILLYLRELNCKIVNFAVCAV